MVNKKDDGKLFSFSASDVFPMKLFTNGDIMKSILKRGYIPPAHVQLNPTNNCNQNCPFCSCSERDKKLELSYDEVNYAMTKFKEKGCVGVTVTGGGEPLMHKDIHRIIDRLSELEIEIGLVSNGWLLPKIKNDFHKLRWVRISQDDYKDVHRLIDTVLDPLINGQTDFAFSYVVSAKPDYDKIEKVVRFANKKNMTHVRLVTDLLDLDNVPEMSTIKSELDSRGVDDSKVIYQGRKSFEHGAKDCWVSLLRPVVDAKGDIFPCCGTQYLDKDPSLNYHDEAKMGNIKDIDKIWSDQQKFNGSVCFRCYYGGYNKALDVLIKGIEHKEFI